jgi:hypothetical protein
MRSATGSADVTFGWTQTRHREFLPSLRVVNTSGYIENAIVHNDQRNSSVELLSEPLIETVLPKSAARS